MAINLYLTDGVQQINEFQTEVRKSKDGKQLNDYYLKDLQLSRAKGRWCIHLHDLTDPIPPIVKEFVDEISFYDRIPSRPHRDIGIYRHEDAEAQIDRNGDQFTYGLWIRGKRMENMLVLYRMIRAGTIAPTENWDAEQVILPAPEALASGAATDESREYRFND